jgi:hypothetical protein
MPKNYGGRNMGVSSSDYDDAVNDPLGDPLDDIILTNCDQAPLTPENVAGRKFFGEAAQKWARQYDLEHADDDEENSVTIY